MNVTEKKTVSRMIHIYCHAKHGIRITLCESCTDLHVYAQKRLSKCVYGDNKPTCKKCPSHCYKADMKTRIKEVMSFAGPRMIFQYPILSVYHLMKGFKRNFTKRKPPIL